MLLSIESYLIFFLNYIFYGKEDEGKSFHTSLTIEVEEVEYFLFTKANTLISDQLIVNDVDSITESHFNTSNPVKILIHGWKNKEDVGIYCRTLKNAYLDAGDYNVIVVSWYKNIRHSYATCCLIVEEVGKKIATLIDFLVELGSDLESIHIIGYSLGAHIAGAVGKNTNDTICRITGLDPAGPLFHWYETACLKASDAEFVDVIHTSNVLGFNVQMGDVDFYPNDGVKQPDCDSAWDIVDKCSHVRSYYIFAESIRNKYSFLSYKCDNWLQYKSSNCSNHTTVMGEYVDRSARGKYFLETNPNPPYALETNPSITPNGTAIEK